MGRTRGSTTISLPLIQASRAISLGGGFSMSAIVPGSALDEDWGEDEVYAVASVEGFGDFRSNTIHRHF